jgi:hypothetical protein
MSGPKIGSVLCWHEEQNARPTTKPNLDQPEMVASKHLTTPEFKYREGGTTLS